VNPRGKESGWLFEKGNGDFVPMSRPARRGVSTKNLPFPVFVAKAFGDGVHVAITRFTTSVEIPTA